MMTNANLELVSSLSHQPIYTKSGRLFIGDIATTEAGVIGCAARANPKPIIAAITRDKLVIVFEVIEAKLRELARHACPKRLTQVLLRGEKVVVSDGFGDVYALPLEGWINLRDEVVQDEHRVLGHFSTVTDIALCDRRIASGDRDGKIRVSRYPLCYVIEGFCLGHKEFVTSLCWWGERLVSGGGDGCVRVWNEGGDSVGLVKVGDGDVVRETVKGGAVVGKVVVCPWNAEKVLIAVVDCCAVFEMESGRMELTEWVRFEGKVRGMEGGEGGEGGEGVLWVCTMNGLYKIREDGMEKVEVGGGGGGEVEGEEWSRFAWLARQRKKEMVEDWKGKKRRYGEM